MANQKSIIIDFGKISTPYCGLAEVALNLAEALNRLAADGFEFTYVVPSALREEFDRRVGANQVITPNYKGLHRILYYLTGRPGFLCEIPKHDVYHYLHFYSPWGPSDNDKHRTLLTIHDFHALERKRASNRLNYRLSRVAHLAFISNFAFEEYNKHIKSRHHSTHVITNGVKIPPSISMDSSRQLEDKYGEFLFTLGGLKRKNIHSLLGMLQKVRQQSSSSQLKLLVAGSIKDKYKNELVTEAKDKHITEAVIFLGQVSEQEKYQYLQACRAFVFPSLQEGFGLPVIEALHFGKPVFCSNKTSLPEVGGDQVYYWENFDSQYMANVLLEGLADNDSALEKHITARQYYARSFDWDKNAKQYVDLYTSIVATDSTQ